MEGTSPARPAGSAMPTSSSHEVEMDEIDEVVGRLETIAEHLAELALEQLRQAVDGVVIDEDGKARPDPTLLAEERRLARARRAVEKAIAVLNAGRRADDQTG